MTRGQTIALMFGLWWMFMLGYGTGYLYYGRREKK